MLPKAIGIYDVRRAVGSDRNRGTQRLDEIGNGGGDARHAPILSEQRDALVEPGVSYFDLYRHVQEPRGRATRLIDFFADPHDEDGVLTLLRFVDREAQAADSDKIRVYATHAGFRKLLRKNGYYPWRSHTELVARINAVPVDAAFYASADGWHITAGDSDHDH